MCVKVIQALPSLFSTINSIKKKPASWRQRPSRSLGHHVLRMLWLMPMISHERRPASLCVVLLLGYRPDKEADGGPQGWGKLERAEVQHTYLETTGAILNVQVVLVRFRHGEEKTFSVFGGRAARSNFDTEVVSPPVPRIHSLLYTGGDPSWPAPRRGILWHRREARERRERSQPATLAFSSMGDSVNTHVSRKGLRGRSRHVDFSGVVRKDFPLLALPRPVLWGDSWQETRDRAGRRGILTGR